MATPYTGPCTTCREGLECAHGASRRHRHFGPRPVTPTCRRCSPGSLGVIVGAVILLWFAPGSYQVYKALHVLAIVIWVGGDITLTTLGIVFERRRDGETLAALGKVGAWIGVKVYTPALFAALAFGIALVQKGGLGVGDDLASTSRSSAGLLY